MDAAFQQGSSNIVKEHQLHKRERLAADLGLLQIYDPGIR
jgi:hypothetical protein